MPTTDPVKRRKPNCENQKRWRQRQFDTLQTLSGRVQELEIESDDLRSRLQDSQAELETLRATAGRLEAQASPSLGQKWFHP
jgi:molecular chaperone GrpE (heat shock protein)